MNNNAMPSRPMSLSDAIAITRDIVALRTRENRAIASGLTTAAARFRAESDDLINDLRLAGFDVDMLIGR